jgi:hypothetical protein
VRLLDPKTGRTHPHRGHVGEDGRKVRVARASGTVLDE